MKSSKMKKGRSVSKKFGNHWPTHLCAWEWREFDPRLMSHPLNKTKIVWSRGGLIKRKLLYRVVTRDDGMGMHYGDTAPSALWMGATGAQVSLRNRFHE